MTSRIDILVDTFREFIKTVKINNSNHELCVEYTPYAYDYIDDDLDFNEEYYSNLCASFQKWLETTIRDMIRMKEIKQGVIIQNRMLFRNADEFVKKVTMCANEDETYISVRYEHNERL